MYIQKEPLRSTVNNYSEEYCKLARQTPFLNLLSWVKAGDGNVVSRGL